MMQEPSTKSDNEWIAQSLRGDTQAFGMLVLRYRKLVIGVAYRICGDAMLAEDIAQEAFVRAWGKLDRYRPQGNFKSWLCRIAANLTIDTLRKHKPALDIQEVSLVDPGEGPEAAALQSERVAAVRRALMRLPLHSRAALVLREYQGFSYQEIADTLDIPLGTVKSRLSDARRRLQVELAGYVEA
jgi:RNA polymerase sigma factor (sigma-70 family)